jgi:DNA-binding MarR family transcriptional regulator
MATAPHKKSRPANNADSANDDDDAVRLSPHVPGIDYDVLDRLIGYGIRRAQLTVYDDFIRSLAPWDMTPPRFSALTIISKNPGLKLIDLSGILGVARSGAVLLINTLEQMELVERHPSATDRRAYGLHLSDKGQKTLDRITKVVLETDTRVSAHLSERERTTLLKLLRKLAKLDQ